MTRARKKAAPPPPPTPEPDPGPIPADNNQPSQTWFDIIGSAAKLTTVAQYDSGIVVKGKKLSEGWFELVWQYKNLYKNVREIKAPVGKEVFYYSFRKTSKPYKVGTKCPDPYSMLIAQGERRQYEMSEMDVNIFICRLQHGMESDMEKLVHEDRLKTDKVYKEQWNQRNRINNPHHVPEAEDDEDTTPVI